MQLLILFLEFFKIGLFSVGGGLATLPFLYDLADKYPWLSAAQIPDMIAISESTPGPLGVNMATYVGFQCGGTFGQRHRYSRFGNTFCHRYHHCL